VTPRAVDGTGDRYARSTGAGRVARGRTRPASRSAPHSGADAAATVTTAIVAGGAATGSLHPSSTDDVQAIINAWPKKYTGVGLVVDPPADTVTDG
jgi:hypothetical protein